MAPTSPDNDRTAEKDHQRDDNQDSNSAADVPWDKSDSPQEPEASVIGDKKENLDRDAEKENTNDNSPTREDSDFIEEAAGGEGEGEGNNYDDDHYDDIFLGEADSMAVAGEKYTRHDEDRDPKSEDWTQPDPELSPDQFETQTQLLQLLLPTIPKDVPSVPRKYREWLMERGVTETFLDQAESVQSSDVARHPSPVDSEHVVLTGVEIPDDDSTWNANLPLRSAPPQQHGGAERDHTRDQIRQLTQAENRAGQQTVSPPPPTMPPLNVLIRFPIAGLRIVDKSNGTVDELSRDELLHAKLDPSTNILHVVVRRGNEGLVAGTCWGGSRP